MPVTHYPFTLHHFTSPNNDPNLIKTELLGLLDLARTKQEVLIKESFALAVEKAVASPEILKGSSNRYGQKLGLNPVFTAEEKSKYKHSYALTEMIRSNLGSLVGSYAQRHNLFTVITNLPDVEPKVIAIAYKELTGNE